MPKPSPIAPWVTTALALSIFGGVGLTGAYYWVIEPLVSLGVLGNTAARVTTWTLVGVFLVISTCLIFNDLKKDRATK